MTPGGGVRATGRRRKGSTRCCDTDERPQGHHRGGWAREVVPHGVLAPQGGAFLDDISFTVGSTRLWGPGGANGAGKTTTIKILNCLAFPDGGPVRLFGERGGVHSASRRRIGFMPEQPYFYDTLPVSSSSASAAG